MTTPQPAALPEPVGFRHSLTHTLHETEAEVQLADAESEAEPLYTADQMRARDAMWAERLAALQPQPAAAVSDEEIERIFKKCGGKWNGDHWVIEDADLHPAIQEFLALRPQAVPMTPDQLADKCEAWIQGGGASNIVDAFEAGYRLCEHDHGITAQGAQGGEG